MKKREQVTIGHLWGAFYPVLLYFAITMVASSILMGIAFMQGKLVVDHGKVDLSQLGSSFLLTVTFFGALMTVPFLILIKHLDLKKQKLIGAYGYKSVAIPKYLLIIPFAVTFMYSANMIVTMIEKIFPSISHSFDETAKAIYGANIYIQIATAVILGPIVEELIFRGLMYIRLKRMFGGAVAALVTGLIFGIYHMNISQGIYAFIFSYAAIFVYEKYKNICAPIIFHMAANGVSVLVSFMLKDYNTSSGSIQKSASSSTGWASIIFVFGVSTLMSVLFGLLIKYFVNPKKK